MNAIRANRLLAVLILCALGLSLIAAIPGDPDAPQALHSEEWVSGELIGNRGGAFGYYSINYPGDGSVVTIEVRYQPADPGTKRGFGFNVYGPHGFVLGEAVGTNDRDGYGVLWFQYSDHNPATWLVQVYNYIPGHRVGYGIIAKDLHERKPQPQPTAAPLPKAAPPIPLIGAGYLTGWPGGSYTFYNVTVAVSEPDVQLTLTSSASEDNLITGVGFVVYGPSGEVARGTAAGVQGERKATLPATAPGVYRVQVYNYIPGLTVSYLLRNTAAGK